MFLAPSERAIQVFLDAGNKWSSRSVKSGSWSSRLIRRHFARGPPSFFFHEWQCRLGTGLSGRPFRAAPASFGGMIPVALAARTSLRSSCLYALRNPVISSLVRSLSLASSPFAACLTDR